MHPDPAENDWADVLERAEAPRGSRRISAVRLVLVCALVLLVAVPSLAATGGLHALFSHPSRQLDLSTVVRDASGRTVASLDLGLAGTVLTNDRGNHLLPHRLVPVGQGGVRGLDRYDVRWRLSIPTGNVSRVAVAELPGGGRRLAVLCSPCADGDSGELTLSRRDASLLVNARLSVVVDTGTRVVTAVIAKPTR